MLRIGVDIGGTFTDVVLVNDSAIEVAKVATDHDDPVASIRRGVAECVERAGVVDEPIEVFCHGTTIGTNAVLERRGSTPVLVTTAGFRDSIELGTLKRPAEALYDIKFKKPRPLVPRSRRIEVAERLDHTGSVVTALCDDEVQRVLNLISAMPKVDAIAVSLLFAFKNGVHEQTLARALKQRFPRCFVVASSDVLPVIKEYERTAFTALCAYLGPVIADYFRKLTGSAGTRVKRGYFVMQSYDGLKSVEASIARPADIILSGPAAGVVAAQLIGARCNHPNVISLDIGGTSTDVSLIEDGAVGHTTERSVDDIPVLVPMVDIHTVGAGGGSKIWIDTGGGLRVGPQSAGASPGPACYGRGGADATVTDADVILGYLNPKSLLSGEKAIFLEKARKALLETVCKPTGLDIVAAARGALRIYANAVQGAIRVVSIERGRDPRDFALVSFGGAGSTHSCEIAEELGIQVVIVPPFPGITSALGLLAADVTHERVHMVAEPMKTLSAEGIRNELDAIRRDALQEFAAEGVPADRITRSAEVRFRGQSYAIAVPIEPEDYESADLPGRLSDEFVRQHKRLYGFVHHEDAIELNCFRTRVSGAIAGGWPSRIQIEAKAGRPTGSSETRRVHFIDGREVDVPVLQRSDLDQGQPVHGPVIIEQYDTTTVVPAGWSAVQEDSGESHPHAR